MKGKKTVVILLLLTILTISTLTTLNVVGQENPNEPHAGNALWIEPSLLNLTDKDKGYKFNITLWINLTTVPDPGNEVGAWQAAIAYNKTLLNFTRYDFTARTELGAKISQWFKKAGVWKTMPRFDRGSLNTTHNYLMPGETWLAPDPGEPENPKAPEGSYGSLVWIEFELIDKPSPPYIDYIQLVTTGVRRCKILDENNVDIAGTFSFYQATIVFGAAPPPTYDATITAYCNTEATSVSVAISMDGNPTGFNTPHTFTGLTGTHTFTVPNQDSSGHPFKQWNTGETTTTITISTGGTYTAYYEAPPPPPVGTAIYVDPPELVDPTMLPSSTFWINITLVNATNMKNCIFNLTYNPEIIGLISMSLFKVQNQFPTPILIIDDETGFVWTKLTYASPVTVTQATALMAIQFHVNSIGATPLDLHDTQLLDPTGNPIEHEARDGYFATLIRDLTITNVTASRSWVYEGWNVNITATVKNNGNQNETFWLAIYYDNNLIANCTIENLAPNNEETRTFTWNTTGVAACTNYTIKATVPILPYENNISDNQYIDGGVKVRILGDVDGSGMVDIQDIYIMALSFGTTKGSEGWNPDLDLNQDDWIDIEDLYLVALNYGRKCT
jgi:hypothetical protein